MATCSAALRRSWAAWRGPHPGFAHMGPMARQMDHMTPPAVPGAPGTADALNHPELNNPPPPIDAARMAEDQAAAEKAALAAGVVLFLAAFVSALGGSLGAAHVKHDRERHLLATKKL